jgi:hypothetical protein
MHSADEVPGGISPLQELLQRLLRISEFGAASRVNSIPQRGEHIGVQIYPPGIGGAELASSTSVSEGSVSTALTATGLVAPAGCADVHSMVA